MFGSSKQKLMDYANEEAMINAQFQIECADSLQKSSGSLFTVLLSGAGGGLALSVSLFQAEAAIWLWFGVAAVSVYLFGIAAIIAYYCLQAQDLYPPANEPGNIYKAENLQRGLDATLEALLASKQRCIDWNIERNARIALWFNRASLLATGTPLVFVASVAIILFFSFPL